MSHKTTGETRSTSQVVKPGGALGSLAAVRVFPALCIFTARVTQYRLFSGTLSQSVSSGVFNKVGYESVSFFVVLSGFILTWVALKQGAGRLFVTKRLLKIFPTHVVMWVVCLGVLGLGATSVWTALANLFLVHGWFADPSVFFTMNVPAWTLCVELLFYASFPLLFRRLTTCSDRALVTLLVVLTAVVALLPVVLGLFPDGRTFTEPAFTQGGHQVMVSEWKFWIVYIFPVTRTVESVVGMLICLVVARGRWPFRNVTAPLLLLLAACTAATLWAPFLVATSAATIVPIVLLVGCAAAADRAGTPSPLRIRRFVPLAGYTFNFYLAQWVIIQSWRAHLLPAHGYRTPDAIAMYCLLLVVTLALAYALHHFVELPVTRYAVKRLKAVWGTGGPVAPVRKERVKVGG